MGNTIAMCTDCLKETLRDIESYVEPIVVKKEVKPLFPHPELDVTLSSVTEPTPTPTPIQKPKATSNNKKKTNKKK